jgi:hypothetical protein
LFMATEVAHAQQASHNQLFLDSIDPAKFPDWIVTAAFYKAVHLAEGLLVRKGCPTGNHSKRNDTLKRHFPSVWRAYRPLYNQSRVARYWCVSIYPTAVAQAHARLAAIEAAITAIP